MGMGYFGGWAIIRNPNKASGLGLGVDPSVKSRLGAAALEKADEKLGWVFHILALSICREADDMNISFSPDFIFPFRMEILVVFILCAEEAVKRLKQASAADGGETLIEQRIIHCLHESCDSVKRYVREDIKVGWVVVPRTLARRP